MKNFARLIDEIDESAIPLVAGGAMPEFVHEPMYADGAFGRRVGAQGPSTVRKQRSIVSLARHRNQHRVARLPCTTITSSLSG